MAHIFSFLNKKQQVTKKVFLCLAKSAREGGLSIAGKEIKNDELCGWFRQAGSMYDAISRNEFPFEIVDVVQCEMEVSAPQLT